MNSKDNAQFQMRNNQDLDDLARYNSQLSVGAFVKLARKYKLTCDATRAASLLAAHKGKS
jgi:hypothetical protein